MNMQEILKEQEQLNVTLAKILKQNGISRFRMTSLGNSIGSGYSLVRTTKPLLLRNETISKIFKNSGICTEIHHFARAQNNSDERLYNWVINNIKETEIHKMNRVDYGNGPTHMATNGLTQELMDEYYPTVMSNDLGLQDAILETCPSLANVVIYNGCTGSFLDNVTRNGKLLQKGTYGIKRDISGLEATLKLIQAHNRETNTNTQVYLCGAPNFLGLNISNVINRRLKKIAKQYANVSYVEPVKSNLIYSNLGEEESKTCNLKQKLSSYQIDIHYSEKEYFEFNNHIIGTIIENYVINQAMIAADRNYYHYSSCAELQEFPSNTQMLIDIIKEQCSKIQDAKQKEKFLKQLKWYLLERFPYDYFYLRKNKIEDSFNSYSKIYK